MAKTTSKIKITEETPKEVSEQVKNLKSKNWIDRKWAVEKLGDMHHPAARQALMDAYMKDKDEIVKRAASFKITPEEFIQIFNNQRQNEQPNQLNKKKAITFGRRK